MPHTPPTNHTLLVTNTIYTNSQSGVIKSDGVFFWSRTELYGVWIDFYLTSAVQAHFWLSNQIDNCSFNISTVFFCFFIFYFAAAANRSELTLCLSNRNKMIDSAIQMYTHFQLQMITVSNRQEKNCYDSSRVIIELSLFIPLVSFKAIFIQIHTRFNVI